MRISFQKSIDIINNANNIALFCHTRPDGDTLGSALALKLALQKINKIVDIYCDDPIPEKFCRLGFEGHFYGKIDDLFKYDLYLALDCGDIGRVGLFGNKFLKHNNTLAIDHHITHQDFAKQTYVENLSSTCEIVLKIINNLNIPLNDEIATILFVGLSTDTGNFKHNNTNQSTFNAAKQLADFDVDISEINRILYNETQYERLKLLGRALTNMRKFYGGRLCIMFVTLKDFQDTFSNMSHTEGFTDYAINVKTAQIGVCISQHNKNTFKISMRSKKINVAEICGYFGGGGHALAAGCMMSGFLEDIIDKIVRIIEDVEWTDF